MSSLAIPIIFLIVSLIIDKAKNNKKNNKETVKKVKQKKVPKQVYKEYNQRDNRIPKHESSQQQFFERKTCVIVDKEKETIFEKDEDYNEISQLIKTNLATTEVTQTAATTNNSNTTEQVQHTEVVEVPTPQGQRGTTSYTPPRVQNSPAPSTSNTTASNTPSTPTLPAPVESSTTETSGTSE